MSSQETDRLAREAEQHRSQVDDTIDRLKNRFSVGQIVDELSGYVREGQGAEMARNLNRQVRDNPLALGLVGAGIAWLLMGQSVRHQGGRLRSSYDDWRGDDWRDDDDEFSGGYPIADGRPHTVGSGPYGSDQGRGASSSGRSGPGLADRAKGAASSASHAASSAASGVAGAARSAGSTLSGAAQSAGEAISGAASSLGGRVGSAAHGVYGAGDATYRGGAYVGRRASRLGRRASRTFLDTLQEEPLIVGAVAVAVGAAIGAALPSTRTEDEWLGEARDRLRDDAMDYGRETLHRAEHVAQEAYRAGSEEAERKGLKPTGEGETLAQKVSSVAKSAADAAREDAKKEGLV